MEYIVGITEIVTASCCCAGDRLAMLCPDHLFNVCPRWVGCPAHNYFDPLSVGESLDV